MPPPAATAGEAGALVSGDAAVELLGCHAFAEGLRAAMIAGEARKESSGVFAIKEEKA
jgi:hypothetical protein